MGFAPTEPCVETKQLTEKLERLTVEQQRSTLASTYSFKDLTALISWILTEVKRLIHQDAQNSANRVKSLEEYFIKAKEKAWASYNSPAKIALTSLSVFANFASLASAFLTPNACEAISNATGWGNQLITRGADGINATKFVESAYQSIKGIGQASDTINQSYIGLVQQQIRDTQDTYARMLDGDKTRKQQQEQELQRKIEALRNERDQIARTEQQIGQQMARSS